MWSGRVTSMSNMALVGAEGRGGDAQCHALADWVCAQVVSVWAAVWGFTGFGWGVVRVCGLWVSGRLAGEDPAGGLTKRARGAVAQAVQGHGA